MAEVTEIEKQQQWTALHLLIAAILQLVLVHIAYRIERRKAMPYISTSSWAIVFGIMVQRCLRNGPCSLELTLNCFSLVPS